MFLGAHPTTLKGAATAVMPGVAASLAATEGADVFSAFVGVGAGVFASLQTTEGADTVSMAVRTANNVATLATTEAPDTFTGTINYGRVVASVAATEGADTLSFTANVGRVAAALATTEGADTLSFTARTGNVSGALATTEGADTVSMAVTAAAPNAGLRPQDVFAPTIYTGTGSTRDIPLGFRPDFVWFKSRGNDGGVGHALLNSRDAFNTLLRSNTTDAEGSGASSILSSTATGLRIVGDGAGELNNSGNSKIVWPFARAPKFFDVITYTGDGTPGRQIPHGLGVVPGMIVVKRRDAATNWPVYHRATSAAQHTYLNLTDAASSFTFWNSTDPTSAAFSVGSHAAVNASGATYVAELYAHDPDPNGIIQCGAGNATLPYPVQWVLYKDAGAAGDWMIADGVRGFSPSGNYPTLRPNTAGVEAASGGLTVSGNSLTFSGMSNPIYLAIRAPIT